MTAADQPTTEPSGWPEFVETITTGNPPVDLVACTLCGVLLWDAEKHQAHAHPAPQPAADTERQVAAQWADYFEQYDQHVGAEPLTPMRMCRILRGPKPFGIAQGEEA